MTLTSASLCLDMVAMDISVMFGDGVKYHSNKL
jgi:hypothetical protein